MPAMKTRAPAALGVLLIGVLTSCSPSARPAAAHQAEPTNSTAAVVSASPSSSADALAQAALAAYNEAWSDLTAVSVEGNYRDARLAAHISGQLLLTTEQELYLEESHGIATRGAAILHPHVDAANLGAHPPTVTISDCVDSRQFVKYYKATGKLYAPSETEVNPATSTMTLIDGTWMLTNENMQDDQSCTP